jgi:protein SCO1/2
VNAKARLLVLAALAAAAAAIALALFAFGGNGEREAYRGSIPPEQITAPDFALRDAEGRRVRMGDLRGNVVLVTFLDAQCRESCPLIASSLALGVRRLSGEERAQVVALGISVDPVEDTPAAVRSFLARHRAEGALRYLVGPERELRSVWKDFGVAASAETGVDELHSAPVRIFDREGVWVATLHAGVDLTPQNLAHDVRIALES